jgi:hypothetical protein
MVEDSTSSPPATTQAWVAWGLPSITDLIFVALLAMLVFTPLSVKLLGDAGIGWHIRTGQLILANHAVPRADPFSSSMGGKPWFAWEWLYDLAAGELDAKLGLNGVVWLTAVVIAAVFAWLFQMLLRRGVNLAVALALVLLALAASMIHFLARPHVVSWLFTLIWFWILDSSEENLFSEHSRHHLWRRRRFWLLPLLMLVWVNVHGGFLVGFVLLAIFWLDATWAWLGVKTGRIEDVLRKFAARKLSLDLLWTGLLSLAASLVNPQGWRLYSHICGYLSSRFLMDHIEEFQSPNFHGLAQRCFVVLVLIALVALALRDSRRSVRLSSVLTILFAVYAGLYASRNIPISSLLLVLAVAPLVSWGTSAAGFLQRMRQVELGQRGHLWTIAAIILTLFIAGNGGRIGSNILMNARFDPKRMPVEAVNFIDENHVSGPILSPDSWGGYLIYRLYPNRRPVVDDRHDFYGEEFLKSYLKTMHAESGWREFLEQYGPFCLLLPKNSALASVVIESGQWQQIYADDVAIAFIRSSSRDGLRPRQDSQK